MKKNLYTLSLLFFAAATPSQNLKTAQTKAFAVDWTAHQQAILNLNRDENPVRLKREISGPSDYTRHRPQPTTSSWQLLCGSMNCYGMVGSHQRPLQYNSSLKAISFIHRKSESYLPVPNVPTAAESGVILGEVSFNDGSSWDSTCIWANNNDWGRYPQGAMYNPKGNTNPANAYLVGTGVVVDATDFSGSWYASKKLDVFNQSASTLPGAQQFYSFNALSFPPAMPRHGWMHNGFAITNDGVAHALGVLGDDLKNTTTVTGYAVASGTFNGTAFDWQIESLLPNAAPKPDGSKHLSEGQMVWNPAGTVGYIVGIGVMNNAIFSNRSYQPIIYKMDKTIGSNPTWTLMPGLDFNNTFTAVPAHLPGRPVNFPIPTNSLAALPFTSDFDITIDKFNNLHIGIVFMSGFSDHPDSLHFFTTFASAINPTENYKWQHLPGDRPYLYDFVGNGDSPWKMWLIDSMSTEEPSIVSGQPGYNDNPWDPTGPNAQKIPMDPRLQMSRTVDGDYVIFTWTESDTLYTNNYLKYNTLPDIKARAIAVSQDPCYFQVSKGFEQNVSGNNINVKSRASLHFMSPLVPNGTVSAGFGSTYTIDVSVPITVTNSNPYSQLTNNATWYSKNKISFQFLHLGGGCVGIQEIKNSAVRLQVYPNPAHLTALVKININAAKTLSLEILNNLGQIIHRQNTFAGAGENIFELDISGLECGMYIVRLTNENFSATTKLVKE